MKTVTIPEFMRPFECTINNVRYGPYAPGATVEVPAEVAALITTVNAAEPVENPPETEEEMAARVAERVVTETLDNRLVYLAVDLSEYDFSDGAVDVSDAFEAAGITDFLKWKKWLDAQNVPLISFSFEYNGEAYTAGVNGMTVDSLLCVFPLFGEGSTVPGAACLTIYNSSAQVFKPYARIDVVGAE